MIFQVPGPSSTRSVVIHELAHQWFGDLVTCVDWSNLWLNEGFATYCEALYIEYSDGKDEFLRYMEIVGSTYFYDACNNYRRPLVFNKYKYPDELFDSHSYQKGAWVIHMLRNIVGDDKFRSGLKNYLGYYRNSSVTTKDLQKVMEEASNLDLDLFFRQWIQFEGHPELDIDFDEETQDLKIIQQREPFFEFKLEVKISTTDEHLSRIIEFQVKPQKHNVIKIQQHMGNLKPFTIEWISIDPELKVLELKSLNFPQSMILNRIRKGDTIVERRQALRAIDFEKISKSNLDDELIQILEHLILNDPYYGVSVVRPEPLISRLFTIMMFF